jgi:hypothetical protein
MDLSSAEHAVMERFAEKTHMSGGARAGYMLRREAVKHGRDPSLDIEGAVSGLVERGLLATSENGVFLYLTEAGATALGAAGAER